MAPRDGSGVYHTPIGTDGVPDTTIDSSKYNANVHDVENDLNYPRPIVAGGTGGSSAATAIANLGAETAKQVVTDYGSAVFLPGSFYSAATATAPPVAGHAFSGICYVTDTNNMAIEARDATTGIKYARQMTAGVWGSWRAVEGTSGMSSGQWLFVAGTTFPPNAGEIRLNNATQASATQIYISHLNAGGADNTQQLRYLTQPGGTVFIQQSDTPANWITFNVASVTFTGGDANIAAVYLEGGSPIAAGATCLVNILSSFDVSQIFMDGQKQYARQNIYAAPFDALAYNGLQINGSMEVSQERGGVFLALTSSAAPYVQDGWKAQFVSSTMVVNAIPQNTTVPVGYQYGLALQATTGAALAASDFVRCIHMIEGYRVARLAWGTANAQPITIGFWVYAPIPGTMSVSVQNAAGDRGYIANVVINAANTQEYKTVTIPGDTTGTWQKTTGTGLAIYFCFGCGTTYQGAPNVWAGNLNFATSSTTNFFAANGNATVITGVVVLPGLEAPSAARSALIMRPYDQELILCKRYYEKSFSYNVVPADGLTTSFAGLAAAYTTNNLWSQQISFQVEKCAVPSAFRLYSDNNVGSPVAGKWNYFVGGSGWQPFTTSTAAASTTKGFITAHTATLASGSTGLCSGGWVADARL